MIPPRLCRAVPLLTRAVIAGAALLASSCATEPPPRPAQLDPANPGALESRPLETSAPEPVTPLEATPSHPKEGEEGEEGKEGKEGKKGKPDHQHQPEHQHEHGAGGAP